MRIGTSTLLAPRYTRQKSPTNPMYGSRPRSSTLTSRARSLDNFAGSFRNSALRSGDGTSTSSRARSRVDSSACASGPVLSTFASRARYSSRDILAGAPFTNRGPAGGAGGRMVAPLSCTAAASIVPTAAANCPLKKLNAARSTVRFTCARRLSGNVFAFSRCVYALSTRMYAAARSARVTFGTTAACAHARAGAHHTLAAATHTSILMR